MQNQKLTGKFLEHVFIQKFLKFIKYFMFFSHLNSLIQNVLPILKRKGKDNEKFRNDSTKKLLARYCV